MQKVRSKRSESRSPPDLFSLLDDDADLVGAVTKVSLTSCAFGALACSRDLYGRQDWRAVAPETHESMIAALAESDLALPLAIGATY